MKKATWLITLVSALGLALAGCQKKNNPASPMGPTTTPTSSPTATPALSATFTHTSTNTLTPTQTATYSSTTSPTASPTKTLTPTITGTPTWTGTPTPNFTTTPISGIGWGEGFVVGNNAVGNDVFAELQLNDQPVTNARVVLNSPAMSGPLTLPYIGPQTVTSVFSLYEVVGGFPFQAGQPYTITAAAGGVTSTAAVTAAGGSFAVAPDGSAVSWAVDGNSSSIKVYPQGSFSTPLYSAIGDGKSPVSIPVSVYASPGSYTLILDVDNLSGVSGGTLVYPNRVGASAQYIATFVASPTPTFTPTVTDTPTFTETPTFTDTFTPSPTDTATSTATPTATSTDSPTPSPTNTSSFTDTATPTATSTPSSTATDTTTSTPSSPVTALSCFATFGSGFSSPSGLQYQGQSGNLWLADWAAGTLTEWTTTGSLLATVTSLGGLGSLSQPYGLALDPSGDLYVADNSKHNVYVFSPTGTYLTSVDSGLFPNPLNPDAVAVNAAGTTLYVGGSLSVCAIPINAGSPPTFGGATLFNTTGSGTVSNIDALAVDGSGNVWVTGSFNGQVDEFDPAGNFLMSSNPGTGSFSPFGIVFDPSGNFYVTDINNHFVAPFNSLGGAAATWGASKLYQPMGIATDGHGTFYVADRALPGILAFH